jgi:hypothetical protein
MAPNATGFHDDGWGRYTLWDCNLVEAAGKVDVALEGRLVVELGCRLVC